MSVVKQHNSFTHSLTQRHLFSRGRESARSERDKKNWWEIGRDAECLCATFHGGRHISSSNSSKKIKDVAPEKNKLCQRLDGADRIHGNACGTHVCVHCSPGYDIGKTIAFECFYPPPSPTRADKLRNLSVCFLFSFSSHSFTFSSFSVSVHSYFYEFPPFYGILMRPILDSCRIWSNCLCGIMTTMEWAQWKNSV